MACGLYTLMACGLCLDGLRAVDADGLRALSWWPAGCLRRGPAGFVFMACGLWQDGWPAGFILMACGLSQDGLRAVHSFRLQVYYMYFTSIHVLNGSILKYLCVWHGWCKLPLLRYVRWHRLHEAGVAPTNVAQNGVTLSQNLLSHRGGKSLKKGAVTGKAAADQASVRARAHQQSVRAQGRQEAALERKLASRRNAGHLDMSWLQKDRER